MKRFDIVIIGGGPAGLAAAQKADALGKSVMLIERENQLGGILKQCIHDGFGVLRFGEKLSGPEYFSRWTTQLEKTNVTFQLFSFVTHIEKTDDGFSVTYVSDNGVDTALCKRIILATGCRERTRNQIFVSGERGAGVFTAGQAQYVVNRLGKMPTKKCVILGSGDIGLIMARRLTLEGAKVVGVFEAKPTPSGLQRNIHQCLEDFDIPLHLSKTVTRVFGRDRVNAVEVCSVDGNMVPDYATAEKIDCDALILAVGLIPENEIAEKIGVELSYETKGAVVDQNLQTLTDGVFSCGNALHVFDLADYVSESGEIAGAAATEPLHQRELVAVSPSKSLAYVVPQKIDCDAQLNKVVFFFRSREALKSQKLTVSAGDKVLFSKKYVRVLPPEMERVEVNLSDCDLSRGVSICLEDA